MLADAYIQEDAVNEAHRVDAQHIAIATIERVDILVAGISNTSLSGVGSEHSML